MLHTKNNVNPRPHLSGVAWGSFCTEAKAHPQQSSLNGKTQPWWAKPVTLSEPHTKSVTPASWGWDEAFGFYCRVLQKDLCKISLLSHPWWLHNDICVQVLQLLDVVLFTLCYSFWFSDVVLKFCFTLVELEKASSHQVVFEAKLPSLLLLFLQKRACAQYRFTAHHGNTPCPHKEY
jgi:hypothetical protein